MSQGFTKDYVVKAAGSVVQSVNTQDGEYAAAAGTIAATDTIPANTDGTEVMTASITPTNTGNKLRIDVVVQCSANSTQSHMAAALFQDSVTNALAAGRSSKNASAQSQGAVVFTHWMTAGTVSSTTFKVRAGCSSGTLYFNGQSAARQYGGVMASSITITEYKV